MAGEEDYKELWISHYSVALWSSAELWEGYLGGIEDLFGDRLERLDERDPVRRRVESAAGQGAFVVEFEENEDRRWVSGRFRESRIGVSITLSRGEKDWAGRYVDNDIVVTAPERLLREERERLVELFRLGNEKLRPYYGYADSWGTVAGWCLPGERYQVNKELLGIFWLTYFGPPYCEFFGRERLLGLEGAEAGPGGGVTLRLAAGPEEVRDRRRTEVMVNLGRMSFYGSGGVKEDGQYALSLEQLHEWRRRQRDGA